MTPIQHKACGTDCVLRWVIADDGDEAIVVWCPTCDAVPGPDDLTRALRVEDVRLALVGRMTAGSAQVH